jgi:hypothetical protein
MQHPLFEVKSDVCPLFATFHLARKFGKSSWKMAFQGLSRQSIRLEDSGPSTREQARETDLSIRRFSRREAELNCVNKVFISVKHICTAADFQRSGFASKWRTDDVFKKQWKQRKMIRTCETPGWTKSSSSSHYSDVGVD